MQNQKTWVLFASKSTIAQAFIEKLKSETTDTIFCIARNQDEKVDGKIIYLNNENYIQKIQEHENLNVVLFNGKVFLKEFENICRTDIEQMLESNFTTGTLFLIELFKAKLDIRKVLVIGTRAGLTVNHFNFSLYAASKMAVLGLLRDLASTYKNTLFTYYACPSTKTNIFSKGITSNVLMGNKKPNPSQKEPGQIADEIVNYLNNQTNNEPDLILQSNHS